MAIRNQIQFRRGSSTEWVAISGGDGPALSYGEPGFDVTNNILKIGDGSTSWKDLKAIGADQSLYKVKNTSGGIIYKGQLVRANGTVGNSDAIQVTLFIGDGSVPEYTIMGLATQDMDNNDFGYVTAFGQIRGIDTAPDGLSTNICAAGETWIDGDVLYASASASGKLTKNIPQHETIVAIVLSAADNGSLFVRPTWYPHLSDLHDVDSSGVTDNQYLIYNSGTGLWEPTSSGIFTGVDISSNVSGATLLNIEGTNGNLFSVVDNMSGSLMSVNDITGLPAFEVFSDHSIVAGRFNTNDFVISSGGNVGIGTATPSGKLHVAGDLTVGVDGQNPKLKIIYDDNHVSGDGFDTLIELGRTQDMLRYNAFPLYINASGYGLSFQSNSDGVLFGMEQYTAGNFRPVIAWGDDTQDSPFVIRFNNNIRFQFSHDGNFTSVGSVTASSIVKSGGTSSQFLKADGSVDSTSYQASSTALTTSTNFGGDVSGTYNNIVVADNSHNHIIGNVDGLQSALDLKAPLASPTFTGTPAAPTAASGTNTTQIATTAFVRTEISNLVDAAPGTLDTLNELAAALGDDPNFATTVTNSIATKANTNQTMYIGTTAVTINRSSGSLSLAGVSIDGNAGTATTSTTITANGTLTTQQGTGTVGYVAAIANGTSGLFPGSDNSNSVLTVNRHSGNYYSQLGFSSNGNLYYRKFNNVAIDTTTPWQTIWTSSSLTNLNQLTNGPGYTTNTGTVTSVSALTIGTTGTDITSTVANGTTTPVITLNIPTASASNRGALSSTDWTTFNNKVGNGYYSQTNPIFGQQGIKHSFIDNVLYSAADRFDFYVDGLLSTDNSLFNAVYDQAPLSYRLSPNQTQVFRLVLNTKGNSSVGITYAPGHVYLSFYFTNIPNSVSGRVKDKDGVWRDIINWTNVSIIGGRAVWRGEIPNHNYMVEIELTIVAGSSVQTWLSQIEYVMSRPGQFELGSINKAQNNTLWRNISFRNNSNVTTLSLNSDGNINLTASTASRILSTDANKNIVALDTGTYPSLTELSYVKGVSSNIQTQLDERISSTTSDDFSGVLAFNNPGGTAFHIRGGGNSRTEILRVSAAEINENISSNTGSDYGFNIVYRGDLSGVENALSIEADNQTGTAVESLRIKQDGVVYFNSSPYVGADVVWHKGNDGAGSTLDADLLDGQHASAFQPLLTNPVTGTGTTNYVSKWTSSSGQGNSIIFDNGTNIGIGTSSPSGLLHINHARDVNADVIFKIRTTNFDNGAVWTDADLTFFERDGGTTSDFMHFKKTGSSIFRIDNSGNVGIGLTDPDEKLEVNGNIHLAADGTLYFGVAGTNTRLTDDSGSNRTVLRARGDTFDIINAAGNAFSATLRTGIISGGSAAGHALVLKSTTGVGTTDYISLAVGNNGGTEGIRIINNGNVGIGTDTPASKLEVAGASSSINVKDNEVTSYRVGGTAVLGKAKASSGFSATVDGATRLSGSKIVFTASNDNTVSMTINNSHNVGIGTESPTYKLQVNGSFGATTKSFRIDHPSRPNYTLEYGSLESPYHGVRLTGRGKVVKGSGVVSLPYYLKDLIHDDETINIQITNIKHGKVIYVDEIDLNNDQFTVKVDRAKTLGTLEFFWTFTGTRKDVDKLVVEAEK